MICNLAVAEFTALPVSTGSGAPARRGVTDNHRNAPPGGAGARERPHSR
jgi:hypothetical protein